VDRKARPCKQFQPCDEAPRARVLSAKTELSGPPSGISPVAAKPQMCHLCTTVWKSLETDQGSLDWLQTSKLRPNILKRERFYALIFSNWPSGRAARSAKLFFEIWRKP